MPSKTPATTAPCDDAPRAYTPRAPTNTLLYRTLHRELEPFLARANQRGQPAPRFVEQTLRAYLQCGVLAHGFLRLHCDTCQQDRLVPFSCKRRGVCPSCQGRTMADTAAHLVDRVLPHVPVRQWVLTLPYPLRYRCAYDARLTADVLRAFVRALFATLRRRARHAQPGGQPPPTQCGAVSFLQRFGSALNLNLHFHTLALDGAYLYEPHPRATPDFVALPPPTPDDVAQVLTATARRLKRLLTDRAEGDPDALARDEPLLALLAQASLRTRIATGPQAGHPWKRLGDRVAPAAEADGDPAHGALARHAEMSLHAAVAVPAHDRERLERLCRYVARPPLGNDRLELRPDGSLALRLKTRWRDGTTHIVMQPQELIDRLVPLIPPPRTHQVRYHGILAPAATLRECVVPAPRNDDAAPTRAHAEVANTQHCATPPDFEVEIANSAVAAPTTATAAATDGRARARRMRWAALLQRVFAVDALACPRCGATLRLLAAIEDPAVARAILECLELPARAPPPAPAQSAEPTVSTPGPAEDPPFAPFEFDQRTPYEDV